MLSELSKINNYYNSFNYVSDTVAFDKKDYWQTPLEFEKNKYGDCEDFAIAKFFKLKENKIDSNIVYCLANGEAHMVCLVDDYILDNINRNIISAKYTNYFFIFMFNTEYWKVMKNNVPFGIARDINNLKLWKDLMIRYQGELC